MTFNFKSLIYSSSACAGNIHGNMIFAIGKLNFVTQQFVFSAFPLRLTRSSLDYEMPLHTYKTYVKGILGLGGAGGGGGGLGNRVVKDIDAVQQLTNINRFTKSTVFIGICIRHQLYR